MSYTRITLLSTTNYMLEIFVGNFDQIYTKIDDRSTEFHGQFSKQFRYLFSFIEVSGVKNGDISLT